MRIPPERKPDIIARSGKGESADSIAAWLATEGVKVSGRAIRGYLEKLRDERGVTTQLKAREQLADHVTGDIEALADIVARARALEDEALRVDDGALQDRKAGTPGRAPKVADVTAALKAMKLQAEVLDKKLHYSGAGSNDTPSGPPAAVVVLPPLKPV